MTREWTETDIANFNAMILQQNGTILEIIEYAKGDYEFNITGIDKEKLEALMLDFDRHRR